MNAFGIIIFLIEAILLIEIANTLLTIWVKLKFKFVFPHRNFDQRYSMKKLGIILKSGKLENPNLIRFLKIIRIMDVLIQILFLLLLFSFGIMLLSVI